MDIPNVVVLIEENIQNMAQDIYWSDEIGNCSIFLIALLTKFMQSSKNICDSLYIFN